VPRSVDFSERDAERLIRDTDAAFWVVFGAFVGQLIAPALGKSSFGLAIKGDLDFNLDRLAKTLRIESLSADAVKDRQGVVRREAAHRLPVVVTPPGLEGVLRILTLEGARNMISVCPVKMRARVIVRDDWVLAPVPRLPVDRELAGRALTSCLSYFQRRRHDLSLIEHHAAAAGAITVRRWLFGLMSVVEATLGRIEEQLRIPGDSPRDHGRRFAKAVRDLLEMQSLTLRELDTDLVTVPGIRQDVVVGKTRVYLRRRPVVKALVEYGARVHDESGLANALAAAELEPEEIMGAAELDGWVVDRERLFGD